MGAHTGPIRVYRAPRLHWLATLVRPTTVSWLWLITWGTLAGGRLLLLINMVAAIALAAVVATLWTVRWTAMLSRPRLVIADRYQWEQVDRVCEAIVRHLPELGPFGRNEVRAAVEASRWDLACLIRDQDRLTDLLRATDRSAAALAPGDPLHDELELRHTQLAEQLRSIRTEADERLARLRSLAARSMALAEEEATSRRTRAAAKRARRTLARADAGLADAATWEARADPAADFTERADAVLTAYQELRDNPLAQPAESHRN